MGFRFDKLEIPDVVHITPDVYRDERGFFLEVFKLGDFEEYGIKKPFVQVNHSRSGQGVLRGLHYQVAPHAQGKLVTVVAGEVFDVAVDIRKDSPTFGKWVGKNLSAQDKNMLYIPEGFAHGFCVTSEVAEIIYYCTEYYAPEAERGIAWDDPEIGIKWPVEGPVLSEKDKGNVGLKEARGG